MKIDVLIKNIMIAQVYALTIAKKLNAYQITEQLSLFV